MTAGIAPARTTAAPMQLTRSSGFWSQTLKRLVRDRVAAVSLVIIVMFLGVGLFAEQAAPHDPQKQYAGAQSLPAAWAARGTVQGRPEFVLGTDTLGRDLLSRLIYGARTSLGIALVATVLITLLGVVIGMLAGYAGGPVDAVLMRVTDVFYALPALIVYFLFATVLRETELARIRGGMPVLILAFASVGWVTLARIVRAATVTVREQAFVEAARCTGASHTRILFRHLLPNILGPVAVFAATSIPRLITLEAVLGYLGIGLRPDDSGDAFFVTSWGGIFLEGRRMLSSQPLMLLAPAVCVGLVAAAFTFLGDALRDALDPRARTFRG